MSIVSPYESETQQERRYIRLELGRREPQDIPFANLLSYGSNGSPTITITKTLFSAAVTSTKSEYLASGDLIGNAGGLTTNAAIVSSVSDNVSTFAITQTTTTSRTFTLTSTKTSTISTSTSSSSSLSALTSMRASSNSSSLLNMLRSSSVLETSNFSNTLGSYPSTFSHSSSTQTHVSDMSGAGTPSSTIAGATLGSMAALGIIGVLFWFCCMRRKDINETLKTKLRFGRRKSAQPPIIPWLENQSMEETRTIMLQNSLSMKNRNGPVVSEMPDTPLRRGKSMTEGPISHASWIGLAVSSSTPPRTPPLPGSQPPIGFSISQSANTVQESRLHPTSLMSNIGITSQSQPEQNTSSPMLVPPKPVMRKPVGTPAPIITNSRLPKHENTSPLSPRGIFNALGSNTREVWKRASQVLSPGSRYSVVKKEGQGGFEFLDNDGSLKKDEGGLRA